MEKLEVLAAAEAVMYGVQKELNRAFPGTQRWAYVKGARIGWTSRGVLFVDTTVTLRFAKSAEDND